MYATHRKGRKAYLALLGFTLWAGAALSTPPAHAQALLSVRLDTAPLVGHVAGPFSLDFQLTHANSASNTLVLSNFLFGGGALMGIPTLVGGASGDPSSSVTLTDSVFVNEFTQAFVPGSFLSFDVQLSTNVAGGAPDQFSFALLDRTGSELPTQSASDAFLTVDITGFPPLIQAYASDPTRPPVGGGSPIAIAAPAVQVIAEPGSVVLLFLCLLPLAGTCRRRQA